MGRIIIDRREHKAYLNKLVKRCYDPHDSFSWKDYFETEFDFLPVDLSPFKTLLSETKTLIDKLFDDYEIAPRGYFLLRGFTGSDNFGRGYQEAKALNCIVGDSNSGYSWYAYNDAEMMIYTWCEGDTCLELFETREKYEEEKEYTKNWYKEAYT